MKQIALISGKGGTGKTSFTASFAEIVDCVLVDADIETPNLSLFIENHIYEKLDFHGNLQSAKETENCIGCHRCVDVCRFHAIEFDRDTQKAKVLSYFCRGCQFCTFVCPVEAIYMEDQPSGIVYKSDYKNGKFLYATLNPGQQGSGKLVTVLRKNAEEEALIGNYKYLIIDAAAGSGCPVISSITGVDLILIITEETISGLTDMKRIISLGEQTTDANFYVCINKCGISDKIAKDMEDYLNNKNISYYKFPYIEEYAESMNKGISFAKIPKTREKIIDLFSEIEKIIN